MGFRRYAAAFAASALLHLITPLALVIRRTPPPADPPRRTMQVFVVPPPDDPNFPGLRPSTTPPDRDSRAAETFKPLPLGRIRIDVRKIAARRHLLFPALTPGLALDSFVPDGPALAVPRQALGTSGSAAPVGPPLVVGPRAVQSLVDRAWARRDRWQAFQEIAKLLDTHTSGGSLPQVLQRYRDQNALQPYADRDSRDPRLWTQLSLAADHVRFIGFIRSYASSHRSTAETTELLLLLDTLVQAEQDALHVLLDTEPAVDLELTRASDRDAYELLVQIRQEYRHELARRGLASPRQIDAYYDHVRLAILTRVVAHAPDGYGVNDARFLMGSIEWRAGRRSNALATWRGLTARSDGTYAKSCTALRVLLARTPIDDLEIARILKFEDGRWLSLSYDRLRQFGYRFDTY